MAHSIYPIQLSDIDILTRKRQNRDLKSQELCFFTLRPIESNDEKGVRSCVQILSQWFSTIFGLAELLKKNKIFADTLVSMLILDYLSRKRTEV
jgi:hypothetical protein